MEKGKQNDADKLVKPCEPVSTNKIKDLKIDLNKPEHSLVHLTGNGVEIHSDLIEFITKERLIMEKVKYKKHRHIEAIWKGLSARLSANHEFLYTMKPHDIT